MRKEIFDPWIIWRFLLGGLDQGVRPAVHLRKLNQFEEFIIEGPRCDQVLQRRLSNIFLQQFVERLPGEGG